MAVAAIKGDKTLGELAEQFSVHPTQITEWKQQLLARAADVFGGTKAAAETPDLKTLRKLPGKVDNPKGESSGTIATLARRFPCANRSALRPKLSAS